MDQRIDIKIAIVGECGSGKETFRQMMHPGSKLQNPGNLCLSYLELDHKSFPKISHTVVATCKDHNKRISELDFDLARIKAANLNPNIYSCIVRTMGISDGKNVCNRHVFLTFHHIGNNYLDFSDELEAANIIIYLTNPHLLPQHSPLLSHIMHIIKCSKYKKYLIGLINKCDNLDVDGNVPKSESSILDHLHGFHHVCHVSCKNIGILRKYIYNFSQHMDPHDLDYISSSMKIQKDIFLDTFNHNKKACFARCGYNTFQTCLINIIRENYRQIIDDDFMLSIDITERMFNTDHFISNIEILKRKAYYLETVFKINYIIHVNGLIQKYLSCGHPQVENLMMLDKMFDSHNTIKKQIEETKVNIIQTDILQEFDESVYSPCKIHDAFDRIIENNMNKDDVKKIAIHVCEMYSTKTIELLQCPDKIEMVFNTFFMEDESQKMLSMFTVIRDIIPFETYKMYLIKILLAKLMMVTLIIETDCVTFPNGKNIIISYCKALYNYLCIRPIKKYGYLFNSIMNMCMKISLRFTSMSQQVAYFFENVEQFVEPDIDELVKLDKFVIQMITKVNYHSVIAEDECSDD